ncbi:MAG: hypothetical protein E7247_00005 [Paenibacillaceae bacterium]|nr:hypothetical protein [Paenibacillaceae bacterium]
MKKDILKTIFTLHDRVKGEKQLENILSQAENIIQSSPVKTGRDHPIFSFVSAVTRNIFYKDIFQFNATLKNTADYSSYNQDLGWLENTFPDEYTILDPIIINLAQDAVWSFPWEATRFTNCLAQIGSNVSRPFIFQPNNHFSQLFLPLGLTIINNGNHSTACGIIKGEGSIEVKEIIDNSQNCNDFYFDGTYICKNNDNSKVYKVKQFECGVLFELSRLIQSHDIDFLAGIEIKRKVSVTEPKDTEWKIFLRNNHKILHYYFNCAEGECEVEVLEHTIILITTDESFGTSTTNAAEQLAMFVAQEFDIPLEKVICYEIYMHDSYIGKELVQRIRFEVRDGVLEEPTFCEEDLPEKFKFLKCRS